MIFERREPRQGRRIVKLTYGQKSAQINKLNRLKIYRKQKTIKKNVLVVFKKGKEYDIIHGDDMCFCLH